MEEEQCFSGGGGGTNPAADDMWHTWAAFPQACSPCPLHHLLATTAHVCCVATHHKARPA